MPLQKKIDRPERTLFAVVFGFVLPLQLAFAGSGELLPGLGHLLELQPVRWRRSARHLPAFGGMLEIIFQLVHGGYPLVDGEEAYRFLSRTNSRLVSVPHCSQ
jgi:hypothetical protein